VHKPILITSRHKKQPPEVVAEMTSGRSAMLRGGLMCEMTLSQRGGVSDTINGRQRRSFELDLSLPGVQKLLSIAAEAQRVIDRRERLQAVAEKVA
jgi:hypothetical protein